MTEHPDESLKPSENETPAINPEQASSGAPLPQSSGDASATPVAEGNAETPPADEGLPEWEPLTPELVEDEAIRGDFVIRWTVVGLALLLGMSQITETRTLVHLKNGQYLIGHGFLPGRNDVLSHTAADRKWVNLSWLFDIVMAGVYSLSGGIGLSIVQGLFAGLAFGLLAHTVRPNIRTWWGSICAVLALLTCYLQITIQPELITLLGISFVLWTLVKSEETGQSKSLWGLVPVLWVWAQLDPRAWFGWFLLLLWSLGESISRESTIEGGKSQLWKVTLASLVLTAVHPFLWESWLAPVRMYMTDYPAMRDAYPQPNVFEQAFHPIWRDFLWTTISHRTIAALVLFGATIVTLFLNRASARWSHVLAVVGFNLLSMFATHEFAAASLVNCVVCTLNAQMWYRERFGQVYSVDWRELLFSRGGRAVTVLSFFTLAWLVLSGRLDGPAGKRTGIGFDGNLAVAMNDYQSLNSDLIDDHPFNYSYIQGDLMIWGGQKPFIDSRLGLYRGTGDADLWAVHNKTRRALLSTARDDVNLWKETFTKYKLRQAWPRLSVPSPAYRTFDMLLESPDFQLTKLNSSTAVFVRTDQPDEQTTTYVKDHPFDVVEQAYRGTSVDEIQMRDWPKPATRYDDLFSLRRPVIPSGVLTAQHDLKLLENGRGFAMPQRCACALLAIRNSNESLKNEPNSTGGYQILGVTYLRLGQMESAILSQGGIRAPNALRYFQSITALQQAVALEPDSTDAIELLVQQYGTMGRIDMQLELCQRLRQLFPFTKSMSDERREKRERIIGAISQLEEPVERINNMVTKALDENVDRLQIAMGANQAGGLLRSIKLLEEDAIYVTGNPEARLALAGWLLEAGRTREASELFENLEVISRETSIGEWRNPAALLAMSMGSYHRAIKLWEDLIDATAVGQLPPALYSLPFLTLNPFWSSPDEYPMSEVGATMRLLQGVKSESSVLWYQIALAQLELGANDQAIKSIRKALELNPSSPVRPLLRFYLDNLTGEQIELRPAVPEVEEYADLTEPETTADEKSDAKSDSKTDVKPDKPIGTPPK